MDPLDLFGQFNNSDFASIHAKLLAQRAEAARNKERERDIAVSVAKITELDDWKVISDKIEEIKLLFVRKPEEYHHDPKLAGIDYGARVAMTYLTNWITQQNTLVDTYAKSNAGQNEKTSQ